MTPSWAFVCWNGQAATFQSHPAWTGEPPEKDDVENEFSAASGAGEVSGQKAWLMLLTKTLNHRERDDEPDR